VQSPTSHLTDQRFLTAGRDCLLGITSTLHGLVRKTPLPMTRYNKNGQPTYTVDLPLVRCAVLPHKCMPRTRVCVLRHTALHRLASATCPPDQQTTQAGTSTAYMHSCQVTCSSLMWASGSPTGRCPTVTAAVRGCCSHVCSSASTGLFAWIHR
jgi:hypothetical protein